MVWTGAMVVQEVRPNPPM